MTGPWPSADGGAADGGADGGVWRQIFNFEHYGDLLALVHNSLLAGVLLGLVGGLVGVFVIMRDLPFAVHGISELSFAGASAALLLGVNIVAGSIVGSLLAAAAIGVLGVRARDRNSIIGILMPFGLGLGVLFLSLYKGRAANKFGILTGQIIAVDTPQMAWLLGTSVVVLAALVFLWRPLTFASADPEVAEARACPSVPCRWRSCWCSGSRWPCASRSSGPCSSSRCSSPRRPPLPGSRPPRCCCRC